MVGVHGTASTIFTTVRDAGVNVIMISQASSEHSVCFAVKSSEADAAVESLSERCASSEAHTASAAGDTMQAAERCSGPGPDISSGVTSVDHRMGEQRRAVLVVCICSWACLLRCQSVIDRFSEAIRAGRISKVEKIGDQQMASRKGVAATMFSALAKANINIRCVSLSLTFFSGQ